MPHPESTHKSRLFYQSFVYRSTKCKSIAITSNINDTKSMYSVDYIIYYDKFIKIINFNNFEMINTSTVEIVVIIVHPAIEQIVLHPLIRYIRFSNRLTKQIINPHINSHLLIKVMTFSYDEIEFVGQFGKIQLDASLKLKFTSLTIGYRGCLYDILERTIDMSGENLYTKKIEDEYENSIINYHWQPQGYCELDDWYVHDNFKAIRSRMRNMILSNPYIEKIETDDLKIDQQIKKSVVVIPIRESHAFHYSVSRV